MPPHVADTTAIPREPQFLCLIESDIARYCTEQSFERAEDYYYRMDNLLNREEEPEDAILAASAIVQRLVAQARRELASPDWGRDLDEL